MSKSIEQILKKELKKYHKQLMKDEDAVSELYNLLDEARFVAKCRNCEMEKEYSKKMFEDRYVSCKADKICIAVTDVANKIKQDERKAKSTREEYGERLFDILRDYKPLLIFLKDQSEKQWEEVFGRDYSALSDNQKVSLIALVELDGGLYRIKDVDSIF